MTILGSVGIPLTGILILLIGFMNPSIIANGEAIQDNSIDIGIISSNIDQLATIIEKQDVKFENRFTKLDERLDNLTLLMCEMSNGKHC